MLTFLSWRHHFGFWAKSTSLAKRFYILKTCQRPSKWRWRHRLLGTLSQLGYNLVLCWLTVDGRIRRRDLPQKQITAKGKCCRLNKCWIKAQLKVSWTNDLSDSKLKFLPQPTCVQADKWEKRNVTKYLKKKNSRKNCLFSTTRKTNKFSLDVEDFSKDAERSSDTKYG